MSLRNKLARISAVIACPFLILVLVFAYLGDVKVGLIIIIPFITFSALAWILTEPTE